MTKSLEVRRRAGKDVSSPICVFGLCEEIGVSVRFVEISMEGMYDKGPPPRILLSALRPLPRRIYSCGHELGHHAFGHGTTVDRLLEEAAGPSPYSPEEFLADTFSAFLLMPALGVRRAFARRGWKPASASPLQIYTVACSFGVGSGTLIRHLCSSLRMISASRADVLLRAQPRTIRAQVLGRPAADPLIIADEHWELPTLDAEVGYHLLLPKGSEAGPGAIAAQCDRTDGRLFRAVCPGIVRVSRPGTDWAAFVRVSRPQFAGLCRYRHLEECDDDEPT